MSIFIDNDLYKAAFTTKNNNTLIITATSRGEEKSDHFFGQNLFDKLPYDTLYIKSIKDLWYAGPDFHKLLKDISGQIDLSQYKNIIGYGHSMGCYGILCATSVLKMSHVILTGPLWNINKTYEPRWRGDFDFLVSNFSEDDLNITTVYNENELTPRITYPPKLAYIIYDPYGKDLKHADEIKKHLPHIDVHTPYINHNVLRYLQNIKLLSKTIKTILMLEIEDNIPNKKHVINKMIHDHRKKTVNYFTGTAYRLEHRPKLQRIVLEYGLRLYPNDKNLVFSIIQWHIDYGSADIAADILRKSYDHMPNFSNNIPEICVIIGNYHQKTGTVEPIKDIAQKIYHNIDDSIQNKKPLKWRSMQFHDYIKPFL